MQDNQNNSQTKIDQESRKSMIKKVRNILVIVIITILLVSFFIDRIKDKDIPTKIPVAPTTIPTPKIDTSYDSPFKIEFDIEDDKLDLPNTLPIYTLESNPFSDSYIDKIIKNMGITSKPYISDDPVFGTTYLYYSDIGRVRIIPGMRIVDYKIYTESEVVFINIPKDDELEDLSLEFLVSNGFIDNKNSVEIHKIRALYVDIYGHIVDNSQSNVISVSFIKKVDKYPILAPTHETGIINVSINSDLEVISVYLDDVSEFSKTQDFPTLSLEEIKNKANTQSLVKSLDEGKINLIHTKPNEIISVNINNIEVAYIQENDEDQKFLQPVYLLNGTAKLKTGNHVLITLYLPAIKNL